jgi:hypothetical protein
MNTDRKNADQKMEQREVETLNNKHVHVSQEAILFLYFFSSWTWVEET